MQNLRTSSLIARISGLCFAAAFSLFSFSAGAQPANDNFADAELLTVTNLWGNVVGDNTGALSETGEPSHAGWPPMSTVWYKWTAPRSGEVSFDTSGSSAETILAVYKGNSVGALAQIAANDGAWKGGNSWYNWLTEPGESTYGPCVVRFNAKADETYYIAVGGEEGPLSLSWAYKSSGVFHWTASAYQGAETESFIRAAYWENMIRHDQMGLLVTITRSMGSSGKVIVEYETEDDTALDGMDYFAPPGEVVFNEYEMSRTILIPIMESIPDVLPVMEGEEDAAMARNFFIRITNVRLADGESTEVSPPRIAPEGSEAVCTILDADVDFFMDQNFDTNDPPVFSGPSNAIVNIAKSHFRVAEDEETGFIRIPLVRSGTNRAAITVHYAINLTGNYENTHEDNFFPLNPGSDYATPNPETLGKIGSGADFTPIAGTVTFAQNDFQPKYIDLPVLDDFRPEMNEDLLLTIWSVKDNDPYPMGMVNEARITILYDEYDQAAGAVDLYYNPDYHQDSIPPYMPHPGADNTVYGMVMDANDRTVIVGDFTAYNNTPRNRIARVNPNGTLDGSFNPGEGANDFINSISALGGQYIIGGAFSFYNGVQRNGVARINSDGSLDTGFGTGTGADGTVWATAVDGEGRILIGGEFTSYNGTPRHGLARLNSDGSLDGSFNPGAKSPVGVVNAITVLPSGQIVIGGEFAIPGSGLVNLAAFTTNGTPDVAYNAKLGLGPVGPVYALEVQQGKLLVGGEFLSFNTIERGRIARLNADGSMDNAFDTRVGANDTVYSITVAPTGELYVGGMFTAFNGTHRLGFTRLYADGTVDTTFMDTAYNQFAGLPRPYNNPSISPKSFVWTSAVASDGGVIIGGGFSQVGGAYSDPEIQPYDLYNFIPYYESRNRASIRNRHNLARLVGGATPGPGNMGLVYDSYSVNEQQTLLYVTMTRNNGALGYSHASFNVVPSTATGGADFIYNAIPTTYRGTWSESRMKSDAFFGTNTTVQDIYGRWWYGDSAWGNIVYIPNPATAGSRYATFELSIPSGADHWYLGGENIPICTALGKSKATFTIVDDNRNPGQLGFTMSAYTVSEGTNALITVQRVDGSAGTVQINFATGTNGTAVKNVDYYSTNGTLNFLANQTSKSFYVPIINNQQIQPKERTIELVLSNPNGNPAAPTVGVTNAMLSIVDNDFVHGYVNFASATFSTNEGSGAIVMTLTRTGGSSGALRVHYRTQNGSAISGVNYVGVTNFVEWASGETAPKTIVIPFIPNDNVGSNLYFTNVLYDAFVGTVRRTEVISGLNNKAAVEIVEDDSFGLVQFSAPSYRVVEGGGKATVTVVRISGISQSVSVGYRTENGENAYAVGTAPVPNYVPTNGVLSFAQGEVAKSFDVEILSDGIGLGPETPFYFTVNLSNTVPSGQLGSIPSARVNIIDAESFYLPAGDLDMAFNPNPGFNGEVFALELQPADGKVLVGGDFTLANSAERGRIARLLPNGILDSGFQQGLAGANGVVRDLALQSDGRIVVAGGFTQINGVPRNRIARLIADGGIDTSFNPGTGADGTIYAVAETFQSTNRTLLVGGSFNSVNGQLRQNLTRLKNDGGLDLSFSTNLTINGTVYAIAVYPTNTIQGGKILIGGSFTSINGVSRNGIARLNVDGTLDNAFDPGIGASDAVRAIAIQLDGKVLIGGAFTNFNNQAAARFARLTINGTLDPTFIIGEGANDTVESIQIQPDNRILLVGQFTSASGVTRSRITRLLPDGAVDPSINFSEGANAAVHALVLQPDDMMILGGSFTQYAGEQRNGVARVFGGSIAGAGTFEFVAAQYEVNEASTNAWITLRRRGGTAGAISVQVATSGGTAVPGVNYTPINTPVVFPEGEVFATVQVPILSDMLITDDLTVGLEITSVEEPGWFGSQPYAELTIYNTDNVVAFAADSYFRSEAAVDGAATIQFVRQGGVRLGATVDFMTTTNGTALAGVNYVPVTNTIVFEAGQQTASIKVPVLRDPRAQGDTTVELYLTNGVGTLLSVPFTATLNILDVDQGPGFVYFLSTNFVASESLGVVTINVLRTNGRSGDITVDYFTSPGTALPGVTYQPVTGKLTFLNNEVAKSFEVPVFNNPLVQGDATFYVALTNATGGATIIEPSVAPVTVLDDDIGISFSSPSYTAMDKVSTVALTVLRQNGTNGSTTVQYATTNVTAVAGTNYTATTGTLLFAPGETIKTFNIPIKRDPRVTGMLSFGVNLFNPSAPASLLNPSSAVVVIIDTDPAVGFASPMYGTLKSATNVLITVIRTNETPETATVNFLTTNGTALAGVDYTAVSGTLTFTNGAPSASFLVPIINNRLADSDKTFEVLLANPSTGTQILPPGRASVIITNDLSGLSFSSPVYTVRENGVSAPIHVVRSGFTNSEVTVEYTTADNSATGGVHYLPAQGQFTFLPGETTKTFNVTVLDNTVLDVDHTVLLSLENESANAVPVGPSARLIILEDDGSFVLPAGAALAAEGGLVNNTIDPGETVTVHLALRNASGTNTQNLMATLLPGPGISNPSGSQNYGVLEVKGPSAFRPFTFTATGTNGQPLALTLQLTDGTTSVSNAVFDLAIGSMGAGFTNSALITISDIGPAAPYPSTVNVSGLGGIVSKVSLTLSNFNHSWPSDASIILVSPSGSRSYVMSKAGAGLSVTNATLTFEDSASTSLHYSSRLGTSTNKPTSYALVSPLFPAPAPPGPYATNFAVFNGENPNGLWSLFVYDGNASYGGTILNGWSLRLSTSMPVAADMGVAMTAAPDKVILTSNATFIVTAHNYGPSTAANVLVTDTLPAGTALVAATPTQGTTTTNAFGQLLWSVGALPVNASAQLEVVVAANVLKYLTNIASVSTTTSDLNADDNVASAIVEAIEPEANLSVSIAASGNPVPAGLQMTYSISVVNSGPAAAPDVTATYEIPAGFAFISASPPGYVVENGIVNMNLGLLDVGGMALGTVRVVPYQIGTNEILATCFSGIADQSKTNNEASIKTVVRSLGLGIEVDGADVVLSWDAQFNLLGIQRCQSLSTLNWTDVPGFNPQVTGNRKWVRVPMTGSETFYRPKE